MSEEMYNVKEELQLIKAGHIIKWTFFSGWMVIVTLGLCKAHVPTTIIGHSFPYSVCSALCLGIAFVVSLIVNSHERILNKRVREERWKEHNKKHNQ